jgi:hypothetical protein
MIRLRVCHCANRFVYVGQAVRPSRGIVSLRQFYVACALRRR